jgi:focal adhesion kinase 1
MMPNVLTKKVDFDYLEKEVGLKRFFPHIVMQQKPKALKKLIVKGLKSLEGLNETECMLRFMEKLLDIWKYNQEVFTCVLDVFIFFLI